MNGEPMGDAPGRVIYAKLTSTGAYDVVAHTPGLTLEQARTLAEQLLPGNPQLDASVEELIGHLALPAGGRVVLRFARYAWRDGERGDVYSTDIVLLPDAAFARVRSNPFAVVQRSDEVFDVLAELLPPELPAADVRGEASRVRELEHVRQEARTIAANTLAADRVLLVHAGSGAAALELLTLLLPPSLRPRLTFLTQTFRVPSIMPRVTLVERASANLRDAGWTVLPSPDVDVPMELADRLIGLADDTAVLAAAHELHEAAWGAADPPTLRAGVIRVLRAAGVARAIHGGDIEAALGSLAEAGTEARERAAGMRALLAARDPALVRAALVRMLERGGEDAACVRQLLDGEVVLPPGTTGALIDALPAAAADDIVAVLAARAAADGHVPHLIALLSRDRRSAAARLETSNARIPADVARFVSALRGAGAPGRDIDAAARLVAEAASIRPALADARTADMLHALCRDTVADVLAHAPASLRSIPALRRLLDAAVEYRVADPSAPPLLPESADACEALAQDMAGPAAAALGAALLDRSIDAARGGDERRAAAEMARARAFIEHGGPPVRDLVRHLLADRAIAEHDLVAMPGADALLPLLGGTAAQAMLTRRIVTAIEHAARSGDGVPELAAAVHAAHVQHVRITPGTDAFRRIAEALRAFAAGDEQSAAAAELSLELLSVITSPQHMPELEDAALDRHMTIRLRRLDRGVAVCRAAEQEQRYERFAEVLETDRSSLERDARERLRTALGTGGLSRRLMRIVASVVEKEAS